MFIKILSPLYNVTQKVVLELERQTYEQKKSELVGKSEGKYVLIKGKEIIGVFESEKDAIKIGIEKFGNSPFFVRKIERIEQTQNFTSNLIMVN